MPRFVLGSTFLVVSPLFAMLGAMLVAGVVFRE